MDIPIDIPGLNQSIPSVPSGSLILVRGGNDHAKTYFAQYLGEMGRRAGMRLVYFTSRGKEEVMNQYKMHFDDTLGSSIFEERSPTRWVAAMQKDVVMIIDSFSYMVLDKDLQSYRAAVEDLRSASRSTQALVVLTTDTGMVTPEREAILLHLVDGVVDFHVRESNEGLVRFIRIGHWYDGRIRDNNIFYRFEDMRISVDSRSRVV
ncbi:MAG: hypothetical protein ABR879_05475 [Methanomassiliicoccales archaeon]